MQVTIPLQNFNSNYIHISQRTENTVVAGGGFYRVMYCSPEGTIIGIPLLLSINVGASDSKSLHERYEQACEDTFVKLSSIMKTIYNVWNYGKNNEKQFVVGRTLTINLIKQAVQKAFDVKLPRQDVQYNFLFKCSGVFDTHNEVGITYRFCFLNHQ